MPTLRFCSLSSFGLVLSFCARLAAEFGADDSCGDRYVERFRTGAIGGIGRDEQFVRYVSCGGRSDPLAFVAHQDDPARRKGCRVDVFPFEESPVNGNVSLSGLCQVRFEVGVVDLDPQDGSHGRLHDLGL